MIEENKNTKEENKITYRLIEFENKRQLEFLTKHFTSENFRVIAVNRLLDSFANKKIQYVIFEGNDYSVFHNQCASEHCERYIDNYNFYIFNSKFICNHCYQSQYTAWSNDLFGLEHDYGLIEKSDNDEIHNEIEDNITTQRGKPIYYDSIHKKVRIYLKWTPISDNN